MTDAATPSPWLVLGPPAFAEALGPLVDLRRRQGLVRIIDGVAADLPRVLAGLDTDARILVLEDPSQPSRRAQFAGPLHQAAGGTAVVGWLRAERPALAAYAALACSLDVGRRHLEAPQPLVLLGPRERRYQTLMDTLEAHARGRLACFRWTAERIRPGPLRAALSCGLGAALYAGHGAPNGWLAYGGLAAGDLVSNGLATDRAIAVIFSLACHTAAARDDAFADAILASGVAGAVLAPVAEVPHEATRTLAPAIVDALVAAPPSLCFMLRSLAGAGLSLDRYVVLGDTASTILASPTALKTCRKVFAPAPSASLSIDDTWSAQLSDDEPTVGEAEFVRDRPVFNVAHDAAGSSSMPSRRSTAVMASSKR